MLCGEGHWSSGEGHSHQEDAENIYSLIYSPPSLQSLLTMHPTGWTQQKLSCKKICWCSSHRPWGSSGRRTLESGCGMNLRCVDVQKNKISSQCGKSRMHSCRPAVSSPCLKEFSRTSPLSAWISLGFSPYFQRTPQTPATKSIRVYCICGFHRRQIRSNVAPLGWAVVLWFNMLATWQATATMNWILKGLLLGVSAFISSSQNYSSKPIIVPQHHENEVTWNCS